MRDILFRGKTCSDGRWVEGNLVIVDYDSGLAKILSGNGFVRISYYVDPETVGQVIGAIDKNGVMIFEGDLVEMELLAPFDIWYEVAEVRYGYRNGVMGFYLSNGRDLISRELTVVGNIHDNPEILGRRRKVTK